MGLLDNFDMEDPKNMGLLQFGLSMLGNSGPSSQPKNFGQIFGASANAGLQSIEAAKLKKQKGEMEALQLEQLKQKIEQQKLQQSALSGYFNSMDGGNNNAQTALADGAQAGSVGPTMVNAQRMNAMPSNGGAGAGNLNKLQALAASGYDTKSLFDMYKYANDGIERKAGSFYQNPLTGNREYVGDPTKGLTVDASGNVIEMPGAANAMASIEGAKTRAQEGAKAGFDVLDPTKFVIANGAPFAGTRMDFINQTRPQVQPTSQVDSSGATGLDLSKLSPQQMQFLQKQDPAAFSAGVSRFGQTAQQSPKSQVSTMLQSEADKKNQLGAIDIRQGAQKDVNQNWIKESFNPIVQSGRDSQAMLGQLDSLKNVDIKTGWGTDAKAAAANVLTGLGVGSENAKLFAANAQKFNSVAMERLWTQLNAAKGPQTEGDATRAKATFAQLQNTPEANNFIVDIARAKANQDTRRAQFYQKAMPLAVQEGDLSRIDREWQSIEGSLWNDPILAPYKGIAK